LNGRTNSRISGKTDVKSGYNVETNEVGWGVSLKSKAVKCIPVLQSPGESSSSSMAWCRTKAEAVLKVTVFEITVAVPLSSILPSQ
jgi:hypothetical protein